MHVIELKSFYGREQRESKHVENGLKHSNVSLDTTSKICPFTYVSTKRNHKFDQMLWGRPLQAVASLLF